METFLEIAVWLAAGLLVLLLLFVGMAAAMDRTRDLEPKARRARRWHSSLWLGGFFLAVAVLSSLPMLWDESPYATWKKMTVERWQTWTVSFLLAIVGVRLLIVGRRFPVAETAASPSEGEEHR